MKILKKVSISDIMGSKNMFRTDIDITSFYKDFELFLFNSDLLNKSELDIEELANKLTDKLKKMKAEITAIHVPESLIKNYTSNYLSLCETVRDEKSYKLFELCIKFADKINFKQNDINNYKEHSMIIIIHTGCEKNNIEISKCEYLKKERISEYIDKLNEIDLKTKIKIAVENITPGYTENTNLYNNCGWKLEEQEIVHKKLKYINTNLKNKNLKFGLCIDFCHIIGSLILQKNNLNYPSIESLNKCLEEYFKKIDEIDVKYRVPIYLFHVSKFGGDKQHGELFQYPEDAKLVEKIRELCLRYGEYEEDNKKENAAITLELKDGIDKEKACKNFNETLFYFSAKHITGEFSELLNCQSNKDLKKFFDNLFYAYANDGKDVMQLSIIAEELKDYILTNTFRTNQFNNNKKEVLFGFNKKQQKINLAEFRLKAYIYYARFCNLAIYLTNNEYSKIKFPLGEEVRTEDFRLTMNYFMFNDELKQCCYTGIAYSFYINFLPKKETFYRFNDEIKDKAVKSIKIQNSNIFCDIMDKVLKQINGTSLEMFSTGKNFGTCLFKYCNSKIENWTLRIYENKIINYVECNGRKYSIPAFLQTQDNIKTIEVDFVIDLSCFKKRDSLDEFFTSINNKGIIKERVASITDGEIVATQLPSDYSEYKLTLAQEILLKKAYINKSTKNLTYTIEDIINESDIEDNFKNIIDELKNKWKENIEKIRPILQIINNDKQYQKDPIKEDKLDEIHQYGNNSSNDIYKNISKYITIKVGDADENR